MTYSVGGMESIFMLEFPFALDEEITDSEPAEPAGPAQQIVLNSQDMIVSILQFANTDCRQKAQNDLVSRLFLQTNKSLLAEKCFLENADLSQMTIKQYIDAVKGYTDRYQRKETRLEKVSINSQPEEDEICELLALLPGLREIKYSKRSDDSNGSVYNRHLTDKVLTQLSQTGGNLESVQMILTHAMSNQGLTTLVAASPCVRRVNLTLDCCGFFNNQSLEIVCGWKQLRDVTFEGYRHSNFSLESARILVQNAPQLEVLKFRRCWIENAILMVLTQLQNLQEFQVYGSAISEEGIVAFAGGCPQLQIANFSYNSHLGDAALLALAQGPRMSRIYMPAYRLKQETLDKIASEFSHIILTLDPMDFIASILHQMGAMRWGMENLM